MILGLDMCDSSYVLKPSAHHTYCLFIFAQVDGSHALDSSWVVPDVGFPYRHCLVVMLVCASATLRSWCVRRSPFFLCFVGWPMNLIGDAKAA